jgi:hypothetical protein
VSSNQILEDGQPLYEKDTGLLYIGDGTTRAKDLVGTQIGLDMQSGEDGKVNFNKGLSSSKAPFNNKDVVRKVDLDSAKASIEDDIDDLSGRLTIVETDVNAFLSAADVGDAAVDTLKEIQTYIENDGAAAEQMVSNISTNATNIANIITGNTTVGKATNATKATQDSDGNVIKDTYAKKSDLTGGKITVKNATNATNATKASQDSNGSNIASTYAKQNGTYSNMTVGNATNATTATNANNIKDKNNNYKTLQNALLDMVYPVGSIYMSVNNISPANFLGGTWVPWGSGKVPVGVDSNDSNFNSVEKTGGESSHTLTSSEMPSHTHNYQIHNRDYGASGLKIPTEQGVITKNASAGTDIYAMQPIIGGMATGRAGELTIIEAGGGYPHNNLQPYITCYMWKRTA